MHVVSAVVLEDSRPSGYLVCTRPGASRKANLIEKRRFGHICEKALEAADRSVDIIARRPGIERPAIHGPAVRVRANKVRASTKVRIIMVIAPHRRYFNRPAALEDEEAERRDKLGLREVHVLQVGALGAVLEEQRS